MRVLKMPSQFLGRLIRRELADIGPAASAVALREMRPQLDALFREGTLQLLRIRIRNDKVNARQIKLDHVVDGIATTTAYTEHRDAWGEVRVRGFVDRQVQNHYFLSSANIGNERFDFMSNTIF
jgi:hypothetical protein